MSVSGITNIVSFNEYLGKLNEIKKDHLIAIAVKDTVGLNFGLDSSIPLNKLGVNNSLHGKHGHSYLALLEKGKLIIERMSVTNETIEESITVDGIEVYLKSSVYTKENVSRIQLDGVDYSINLRGINIVIYDVELGRVIDRVCFDTHVKANICYRENDKLLTMVSQLGNQVHHLKGSLNQIKLELEKLQLVVNTESHKQQMLLWQAIRSAGESDLDSRKRFFRSLPPATGVLRKMQQAGLILLINFDHICRENNINYWISFGTLIGAVRHEGFIPWDDDTDVGMFREDIIRLQKAMENNKDFYIDEFYAVRNVEPANINHNYQFHFSQNNTPYSLDIFVYDYSEELSAHLINDIQNIKHRMCTESLRLVQSLAPGNRKKSKQYGEEFRLLFEKYYKEEELLLGSSGCKKYMVWAIDNLKYGPAHRSYLPIDYVFPLTEVSFEGHKFLAPSEPERYANILFKDIYTIPNDILSHVHFNLSENQVTVLDEVIEQYGTCI